MELIPDQLLSKGQWARMRRSKRVLVAKPGRLAYWGLDPGVVGCRILGLSETGIRVETNVTLSPTLKSFFMELGDISCLARRRWAVGREIGLEFIFS